MTGPAGPASRGARGLGVALVCCGVAVLPWLLVLAGSLPGTTRVSHWDTVWIGLDVLEALGLVTTGCLVLRRDPRRCLPAAATAALLVVDVWVDVTTSASGTELVTAVAMAAVVELPLAALCTVLAVRSFPRAAVPSPGPRSTQVPPPRVIAPRGTTVPGRPAPSVGGDRTGRARRHDTRERR